MFRMFPFMFGGSSNILGGIFNEVLFNNIISQTISSNAVQEKSIEESYNVQIIDQGDYYLIKGYLPGVNPRDMSIDFERNRAILTIRKKQSYSNGLNFMMTVVQTGGNLIKTFEIEEIDRTKIGAAYERDILLLTLPKKKRLPQPIMEDEPLIVDVDNYEVQESNP